MTGRMHHPLDKITRITPNRRSWTVRSDLHVRRPYQPFQCAAPGTSSERSLADGPGVADKVKEAVLQTAAIPSLACGSIVGCRTSPRIRQTIVR